MSNIQCKFKRVIKSAFLLLVLASVTSCNQFATFSGTEEEAHLSANPVFNNPGTNFRDGGNPVTPGNPGTPNPPIFTPNPVTPIPGNPIANPPTTTPPPFQWCNAGQGFQVLTANGYTECRTCISAGEISLGDERVPVCGVTQCEGENQYMFFDFDNNQASARCDRCDVPNPDGRGCDIPVETFVPETRPDIPTVTVDDEVDVIDPVDGPDEGPGDFGGDGGGDGGGGDPLMIDSVGVRYANADALRNSNASYFKSGDLDLTAPYCDPREEKCRTDMIERASFEGFNLLGQQSKTRLDNDTFLHISTRGKNFKFKEMSWTRRSQSRYRFLALPKVARVGGVLQRRIHGIDELFGDNTFGPDANKPFAKDGFRALMKYDRGDARGGTGLADGYIDENDLVFHQLRLWHDYNGDGNVSDNDEATKELVSLAKAGVSYIHLRPNEKFFETDQYGNDIAYKSIVGFKTARGEGLKLGTAFDMWFQYQPREILGADPRNGEIRNQ